MTLFFNMKLGFGGRMEEMWFQIEATTLQCVICLPQKEEWKNRNASVSSEIFETYITV